MIKNIFTPILNSFTAIVNFLYNLMAPSQHPESDFDRILRETGEYVRSLSDEELKRLLTNSPIDISSIEHNRDKLLEAVAAMTQAQKSAESLHQINIEELQRVEETFKKVKDNFEKDHP